MHSSTKKLLVRIALGSGIAALLARRLWIRSEAPADEPIEPQVVDANDVADYVEMSTTTYRLRTARDVLPGGLSAAMVPVFVVWDRSSFAPGGTITVRNLNHGGNPITGVTELQTAIIRPERLRRAEFVSSPLGGPAAITHGQLRFVFDPGGVELMNGDAAAAGEPDAVTDIVLSWEAWRAPATKYSVKTGMDPTVYQLSMRAYSGVQRFLEDSLKGRRWDVFPLALPGGHAGVMELFKVSLSLGDGAGRCVMSELLKYADDAWVARGPSGEYHGDAASDWSALQTRLNEAPAPADSRLDLSGRAGYQSIIRSCGSMALYQIDVAAARLAEQGHTREGRPPLEMVGITEIPEWMADLAGASVAGLFLRGPRMLAFAHKYPGVIPSKIPGQLNAAGLLARVNGKPVKHVYTIRGQTPWGPVQNLLVR